MSNIEALDKLRTVIDLDYENCYTRYEFYDALEKCIAEIEREVSDRFVELPVDMDGAPIHEGDVIQFVNEQGGTGAKVEVCAISKHYAYYGEGKHFYRASMCRHVKPRTLEDVLAAFAAELHSDRIDSLDRRIERCAARYAAEIRELMGVKE